MSQTDPSEAYPQADAWVHTPSVRGEAVVTETVAAPTLPDIGDAHYQADGSVRIHYVNDTDTTCAADDTTSVTGKHLNEWVTAGGVIGSYFEHPPSHYDVDIERDRRNSLGQELFLKSGKVVFIATATRADFDNINFASDTALTMIAKTIPALAEFYNSFDPRAPPSSSMVMNFRDFYRREVEVTYHEMAEISVRITGNIVTVNDAAHKLKDMEPNIPADYTDDKYWPTLPLPPLNPPPL